MAQRTVRKEIRLTQDQAETLAILKQYNVCANHFIIQAIREKLKRDWPTIKAKHKRQPGDPGWLY